MIDAIDHYGCWCYFDENYVNGRGEPLNRIDNQCKILHDGYACAELDDEGCVPYAVDYVSAVHNSLNRTVNGEVVLENNLRQKCLRLNPHDDCKINACVIEGN